jgi:hypothetical protein
MKKLFTFCATALLAFTVSAQGTSLDKGTFTAGIAFNSAYDNDAITDDLAFTVGYAVSNEMTIMATRDENAATGEEDAAFNLGLRYFTNGFYGQVNLNDVTGDSDTDMSLSVGSMFMIDVASFENLYIDPAIVLSRSDDETDMSFTVGIGMKF